MKFPVGGVHGGDVQKVRAHNPQIQVDHFGHHWQCLLVLHHYVQSSCVNDLKPFEHEELQHVALPHYVDMGDLPELVVSLTKKELLLKQNSLQQLLLPLHLEECPFPVCNIPLEQLHPGSNEAVDQVKVQAIETDRERDELHGQKNAMQE